MYTPSDSSTMKIFTEQLEKNIFTFLSFSFFVAIDFDEFLSMYKRLFVLCKSVVSHDISDIMPASPRRLADVQSPTKIPVKKVMVYHMCNSHKYSSK